MLIWHVLLCCTYLKGRWFIHLARLSIGIIFGAALMTLEVMIFLLNKIKVLLEKLFYTVLRATKL